MPATPATTPSAIRPDAVSWSEAEQCWQVTGLAEVIEAFRRTDALSSAHHFGTRRLTPPKRVRRASILGSDPPDHARLRAPARAAFTPRAVARFRAFCEGQAEQLLKHALDGAGPLDVVEVLARPLSAAVTREVLCISDDHQEVLRSVTFVAENFDGGPGPSPELYEAFEIVDRFVTAKLAESEAQDGSILESLIASQRHGAFTIDELQDLVLVLIAAGTHTTMHGVSSAVSLLASDPTSKQRLADGALPIDRFVDEVLRFASPARRMYRTAVAPLDLGGQRIPAGDFVCLRLGLANRDPRAFEDPDRFNIDREPSRTVAFGHGIHHCLGAALARVEISSAVRVLQKHVARIDAAGAPVVVDGVFGGYDMLPVVLTRTA